LFHNYEISLTQCDIPLFHLKKQNWKRNKQHLSSDILKFALFWNLIYLQELASADYFPVWNVNMDCAITCSHQNRISSFISCVVIFKGSCWANAV